MDGSQSALDSLRTVEFRETLKGYHRDDVDEYLEKAAVEAEALQEQFRQVSDRLRQAADRIADLESQLKQRPVEQVPAPQPAEPAATIVPDDTLQRTLILAQKFVDETKADAEARAAKLVADATAHARNMTANAEAKAAQIAQESQGRLREDIERLEGTRTQLSAEVETMARHLEVERNRLRASLSDVIKWLDEAVQPVAGLASGSAKEAGVSGAAPVGQGPSGPAPLPSAEPGAIAAGNGGSSLPLDA